MPTSDLSRRTLLTVPAVLSMATATAACAEPDAGPQRTSSKTLVAYFTRSGNTRVIAGTVRRALRADLFEIRPLRPYPEDYEQTVEQARQERDRGYEPPLAAKVGDIAAYDTIFLGFPIWGEDRTARDPVLPAGARPRRQDLAALHHPRRLRPGQ